MTNCDFRNEAFPVGNFNYTTDSNYRHAKLKQKHKTYTVAKYKRRYFTLFYSIIL